MSSEKQYRNNKMYYRAVAYLKMLYSKGLITKEEMRKGNRYYADYFESNIRIFVWSGKYVVNVKFV